MKKIIVFGILNTRGKNVRDCTYFLLHFTKLCCQLSNACKEKKINILFFCFFKVLYHSFGFSSSLYTSFKLSSLAKEYPKRITYKVSEDNLSKSILISYIMHQKDHNANTFLLHYFHGIHLLEIKETQPCPSTYIHHTIKYHTPKR